MKTTFLWFLGLWLVLPCLSSTVFAQNPPQSIDLSDFGAVGDGEADDGPALQKALDALAAAGGGTLNIPAGKYAITTPVFKDFSGRRSSITIAGVESLKPVAPPTAGGNELAEGLDLQTEIYPRTGISANAISISGLQSLVIKDIAFVGTPDVRTDAVATVELTDIDKAQIKHSEFYGLCTLVGGGAIVKALRTDLEIAQSKFLGSTGNSGVYVPIVDNLEWRGITVTDTTFLDYGLRPELFSKTGIAAPVSWINIGNAAAPTNTSPRREVVLRNVFLDEGGYWGLTSFPYRYAPASAPIDLVYITGLFMNVSNFGTMGHNFYNLDRVFIEKSHYGWSHNAFAAIALHSVGTAILDQLTCEANADRLYADSQTKELTVINSTYNELASEAQITNTIATETDEEDPVQYVRSRFADALGRDPDAAAHFYWANRLLHCFDDAACMNATKQMLDAYLSDSPAPTFAISGRVADDQNTPLAGVTVTLSGSQSVTTTSDTNGNYLFANLPTSGEYVLRPSTPDAYFESATFITPTGNRVANFVTQAKSHVVKGTITSDGTPMAGVEVAISGSTLATALTDNQGQYSITLNTGGDYVLTPTKSHYTFDPIARSITHLMQDQQLDFAGTFHVPPPVLLTIADSDRAVALELTQYLAGPFPLTTTALTQGHNTTRIIVFATDLGLLAGEGVEAITAEAKDTDGVVYPLRVEFVAPLKDVPGVSQIVLRLTSDLPNAEDVFITLTVHGLTSNKVSISIAN